MRRYAGPALMVIGILHMFLFSVVILDRYPDFARNGTIAGDDKHEATSRTMWLGLLLLTLGYLVRFVKARFGNVPAVPGWVFPGMGLGCILTPAPPFRHVVLLCTAILRSARLDRGRAGTARGKRTTRATFATERAAGKGSTEDRRAVTSAGGGRGGRAARAGTAAFAWSVLFAAAHAYWAFGGTALLSAAMVKDSCEQWDRDPRGYAVSWAILTLLLVCAGLFPAALAWRGGRVDQRRMERLAVASGYAGMVSLIGLGLATGEPGLSVVGGGGAALGGVFALVRPRGERVSRWLVLVATWGLGGAMIVYGCAYLGVVAFSTVERDNLLAYLVAGGMNWSLGGILFVTTAWLSRGGVRRK